MPSRRTATLLLTSVLAASASAQIGIDPFGCAYEGYICKPCFNFGLDKTHYFGFGWCHTNSKNPPPSGWECRAAEGCSNPSPPKIDQDPGTCDSHGYICKRCYTPNQLNFGVLGSPAGWCHTNGGDTVTGFTCRGSEGCTN